MVWHKDGRIYKHLLITTYFFFLGSEVQLKRLSLKATWLTWNTELEGCIKRLNWKASLKKGCLKRLSNGHLERLIWKASLMKGCLKRLERLNWKTGLSKGNIKAILVGHIKRQKWKAGLQRPHVTLYLGCTRCHVGFKYMLHTRP